MSMTAYQQLLQDYTPRPIRNEAAYRKTLAKIDDLMKRPHLSQAEDELLEVLVALTEQYESREYPTPVNPPDRMLAHLLESKGVTQSEAAVAAGIPRSTLSAVLAGRRQLSKANIARLAEYFGVSPAVFVPRASDRPTPPSPRTPRAAKP